MEDGISTHDYTSFKNDSPLYLVFDCASAYHKAEGCADLATVMENGWAVDSDAVAYEEVDKSKQGLPNYNVTYLSFVGLAAGLKWRPPVTRPPPASLSAPGWTAADKPRLFTFTPQA